MAAPEPALGENGHHMGGSLYFRAYTVPIQALLLSFPLNSAANQVKKDWRKMAESPRGAQMHHDAVGKQKKPFSQTIEFGADNLCVK